MADGDDRFKDDLDAGMGIEAAAELLRVSPRTISKWIELGRGPRPYHEKPMLFTRRSLIEFQRAREAAIEAKREKRRAERERRKAEKDEGAT